MVMIELKTLEGKWIELTDDFGDNYVGKVSDYIFPDDNSPDFIEEAIVVYYPVKNGIYKYSNPVQFNANEIRKIVIVDKK